MKRCHTCQRVYEDEMGFCLEDGSALVSESAPSSDPGATVKIPAARLTHQAPTEVLPANEVTQPSPQAIRPPYVSERTVAAERKPSALPWILGAALILGLSGIVIALILTRNREPDGSQIAQNTAQSENATPELASSNTATANSAETQPTTPERETESRTPTERTSPSPTPARTPSPRSTPAAGGADEAPPPPPKPTPAPERRAPISGGVLNGKAISKPAPSYPAIARAARASGTVTVQVLIDETGRVTSARAVSGHPLLQQSAVQAAYGARFSPTLLSGQPVKVTGVITYNFVAP